MKIYRKLFSVLNLFWQVISSFICLHGLHFIRPFLALNAEESGGKLTGSGLSSVILVHPAMQSRAAWYFYQAAFRKAGFSEIHHFEYSCREPSLNAAAGRLAKLVEGLTRRSPLVKPVLIGASLGGLVARESLCLLADMECLAGLITLACPHKGSRPARMVPKKLFPLLHGISYNSRMIQELEARERSASGQIPKTAFFSICDELVKPKAALRPPENQGWREVETGPLSHMAIMLNDPIIQSVINEIRRFQKNSGNSGAD